MREWMIAWTACLSVEYYVYIDTGSSVHVWYQCCSMDWMTVRRWRESRYDMRACDGGRRRRWRALCQSPWSPLWFKENVVYLLHAIPSLLRDRIPLFVQVRKAQAMLARPRMCPRFGPLLVVQP